VKKKIKTHEEARASHKALQARRDALVKMRKGEIVEIRLAKDAGGELITARMLMENEWPDGYMCLAIINKRLRMDWCSEKNGLHVGPRRLELKNILGVVLTVNGTSLYDHDNLYWKSIRKAIEHGTDLLKEKRESP